MVFQRWRPLLEAARPNLEGIEALMKAISPRTVVRLIALVFVPLAVFAGTDGRDDRVAVATFAGGCFWCM